MSAPAPPPLRPPPPPPPGKKTAVPPPAATPPLPPPPVSKTAPPPPPPPALAAAAVASPAGSTPRTSEAAVQPRPKFAVGTRVLFLRPGGSVASWEEGTVSDSTATSVVVTAAADGQAVKLELQPAATAAQKGGNSGASDPTVVPFVFAGALETLHDLARLPPGGGAPALLHTVARRWRSELPYTSVGPMLVSVNPYRWGLSLPRDSPHPRRLARAAFDSAMAALSPRGAEMVVDDGPPNKPAVVVITGQSGAGKTEAAKMVVRELLRLSGHARSDGDSDADDARVATATTALLTPLEIAQRAADVLLETFGNAATRLNDNSSRFAKFTTLRVSVAAPQSAVASVDCFMLEVSRVVSRGAGEGTFHAFNALFENGGGGGASPGLTVAERTTLDIWDAELFACLAAAGGALLPPAPYSLREVRDALGAVGFDDGEAFGVLRVLAGILHLLNVDFEAPDAFSPCKVAAGRRASLAKAASLLGLDGEQPARSLTPQSPDGSPAVATAAAVVSPTAASPMTPSAVASASLLERVLTSVQLGRDTRFLHKGAASASRDTLAKALYDALFRTITQRINRAFSGNTTTTDAASTATLTFGVLDVFGFETAAVNELPQLLINYANEALQALYDDTTFSEFAADAEREGVAALVSSPAAPGSGGDGDNDAIAAPPRGTIVDVLTRRPNGVLNVITDDAALGQQNANPAGLADKILALASTFPDRIARNKTRPNAFVLRHFCGDVEYTTDSIARMNRVVTSVVSICRQSSDAFVRALPNALAATASSRIAGGGGAAAAGNSQTTLFRDQLEQLVGGELRRASLHWLRCIKPNHDRSPVVFDSALVMEQLHACGVVRAQRLLGEGLSVRMRHQAFVNAYLLLAFRGHAATMIDPDAARELLANVGQLLEHAKFRELCALAAKSLSCCAGRALAIGTSRVFLRADTVSKLQALGATAAASSASILQRVGRAFAARKAAAFAWLTKQKDERLRALSERIAAELPVREALERERIAMFDGSGAHSDRELRAALQRRAERLPRRALGGGVRAVCETIARELGAALQEIAAFDKSRRAMEREELERREFDAQCRERARQASAAAAQAAAQAAARRRETAERLAQRESAAEAKRLVTKEREEQIVRVIVDAKRAQQRADRAVAVERLARLEAARERADQRAAREHLERRLARIATEAEGRSERRLVAQHQQQLLLQSSRSASRQRSASAARSSVDADDDSAERAFALQRDLWALRETDRDAASVPRGFRTR